MNSHKRKSIRRKLQVMVLGISCAILILSGTVGVMGMLYVHLEDEDDLISQAEQNLHNMVVSKASFAGGELSKYASYIELMASYIHEMYSHPQAYALNEPFTPGIYDDGKYFMYRTLLNQDIKFTDIKDELTMFGSLKHIWENILAVNPSIYVIYIGTESGFMLVSENSSETYVKANVMKTSGESYYAHKTAVWYATAMKEGGTAFTNIYNDAFSPGGAKIISCVRPFYDAQGRFAGVASIDIFIADLYNAIVNLELMEQARAFIVDGEGKIITLSGTDTMTILSDTDMGADIASQILAGNTGVSRSDSKIYYAYAPVNGTHWKLCISVPESVILAPINDTRRKIAVTTALFAAAFVVMLAVIAVIVRFFAQKVTEPILALRQDIEKISRGNLDYRAEIRSDDEIGDLAQSFNDMAASLKEYMQDFGEIVAEQERIGTELDIAAQIQADMLPRIFPPFPDRKEFDIYASMTPAKEVGGDFYDFFMIDDDHLALVIADVSGKGVPAALFMVIAKTLIKNRAQMGGSPGKILSDVNSQLCEGNDSELFVTVWLGILEISTGKVTASNAGHEYPALRRAGGTYELIRTKNNPMLAVMEGLKFTESEFTLQSGDTLYIYTDGVAEAANSEGKLYGTDRMLEALNRTQNNSASEILASMKTAVDDFTVNAPQFDDITMLCLQYFGV